MASLRRSDRIKTIETTKQFNKELEIAEKLKKHRNDSASNQETNNDNSRSPLDNEDMELAARLGCKRLSENEPESTMSSSGSNTHIGDTNSPLDSVKRLKTGLDYNQDSSLLPNDFQFPADYEFIDHNVYVGKRFTHI